MNTIKIFNDCLLVYEYVEINLSDYAQFGRQLWHILFLAGMGNLHSEAPTGFFIYVSWSLSSDIIFHN